MQNPVYQDQQEKWKKSKKPDFSKNLPWVFARLVRKTKKNPPTPSIDLKRKQEEKTAFRDSF